MFLKLGFLLFVCFFVSEAKVKWSFYSIEKDHRGLDEPRGVFNATIGTPPQTIQLLLARDAFPTGIQVLSTGDPQFDLKYGIYDPDLSSTFHNTTDFDKRTGSEGATETIVIGDAPGLTLEKMAFTNTNYYYNSKYYSLLSLAHSTDDITPTFLEKVVKTMEEPVVVLTYEQEAHDKWYTPTSGALTLGGKPDDCSDDWIRLQELGYEDQYHRQWQWDFMLDRIEAGKYAASQPGVGIISFMDATFSFPDPLWWTIAKGMGVDQFGGIECNTTATVTFTIGKLDLVIGREWFIDTTADGKGCYFTPTTSVDNNSYFIPVGMLKEHCLLLDYSTHEIGFATRKH